MGWHCRTRRFSWSSGEKRGTPERERSERARRTLGFRPGAPNEGKIAHDAEACNLRNLERAELQLVGNGPTRNEADPESCFHCRFDRFGGIEVHHILERLELEAGVFKSQRDHVARASTMFTHTQP